MRRHLLADIAKIDRRRLLKAVDFLGTSSVRSNHLIHGLESVGTILGQGESIAFFLFLFVNHLKFSQFDGT